MKNPEKIWKIIEVAIGVISTLVAVLKKAIDSFPAEENEQE